MNQLTKMLRSAVTLMATALSVALVGCAAPAEDDDGARGAAEAFSATPVPSAVCHGDGRRATSPFPDARRPTQKFDIVLLPGAAYEVEADPSADLQVSAVLIGTTRVRSTTQHGNPLDAIVGNASTTVKTYRITVERTGPVLPYVTYDFLGICKTIADSVHFRMNENDVCVMGNNYDFQTDVELEKRVCRPVGHANLADPAAGGVELGQLLL